MKCWGVIVVSLSIMMTGCGSEQSYSETNLLRYGLPMSVQTPDSVEVKEMDWGLQKDVTLQGDNGYSLQIFSSMATTSNQRLALSEYKQLCRENPYFAQFEQEDEDGFIFSVEMDSTISYDFRHIKIWGDREYIFQMGLLGTFTREQVDHMYGIAQAAN